MPDLRVYICTIFDQKIHKLFMAIKSSFVKWRPSIIIFYVYICTFSEKILGHLYISKKSCSVKRCSAILVFSNYIY